MAALRLLALLALFVVCSTVLAQTKPCEPCDPSKCPMVILTSVIQKIYKIFVDRRQRMSCRINTR